MVPAAPPANVAVNVATSSFSTGSRVSLTGTPPAWPTATPKGTGRSGIAVLRACQLVSAPLVAVAAGGVGGERPVGVGDGHQSHVRQPRT